MSGRIRSAIDGGICTLTIENEGKRNAISYAMLRELIDELDGVSERDGDYVLVVRGAGEEAFSAGFDLDEDRVDRTPEQKRLWPRATAALETYEFPTVAMINGDAYGGAVQLAAACDLRVGVESAEFGITPAKLGLAYGGEAIGRVLRLVGPAKTKELLFTANAIPASHAAEIGLLNYVVERDELAELTYGLAEDIAANAPLSLTYMKEIVGVLEEKQALSDAERKWIGRVREELFRSRDHREAVEAFRDGRTPEFEGR